MNIDNKLSQIFKNRLVLHVGFWTVCILLGFFGEISNEKNFFDVKQAFHMPIHFTGIIIASYFNLYFLIPRYLNKRKYQTYFVFVLLTVIISTIFFQIVKYLIHSYVFHEKNDGKAVFLFFHISFYGLLLVMITTMFYHLRRRMNLKELEFKLQEAEIQKTNAELKALKAQINPHLLFNALNNIYSLALEQSTKTSQAILELSDLMTYVLYDCQTEKIALSKEITFLKNYILLEKSRFEDSIDVKLNIEESVITGLYVAPLLFLPFVENAFKHCNKSGKEKAFVTIDFDTSELPKLKMQIINTFDYNHQELKNIRGVGLENIKQRLEFLYPNRYKLDLKGENNRFTARLELDLS